MTVPLALRVALAAILSVVCLGAAPPQDATAIDRAKRIVDLLNQQQVEEVTREFNAQMSAVLSATQLRAVWAKLHQEYGTFREYRNQQVRSGAQGTTVVILGCQHEKATLNVIIAFGGDNKIAGLRYVPQVAPSGPSVPPPSSRFKEEPVTVGSSEWTLPGTLSIPVDRIIAGVVLVHGSGPNDRDETLGPNKPFRDLAWGLADRGVAVLRYEKRTRQYGGKLSSIKNFTVREETIDDALAAAALLRQRPELEAKRIVVLGHSLGGLVAPRIAADDPALAGIIIMAGPTRPFREVAREQLTYISSLTPGGTNVDQALEILMRAAPESYWKDLDAYRPGETAAKLRIPMLIMQGERDYQVTLEDLQGWRTALHSRKDVTFKVYPTLNHAFMPGEGKATPTEYERPNRIPEFVFDDIAKWLGLI